MNKQKPVFITGIGTGTGKTFVSAVLAQALQADYWKPVQAGVADGTDSNFVRSLVSNTRTIIHPEVYQLKLPASPHIAAREEGVRIDLDLICGQVPESNDQLLLIEGAGGLLVPLNEEEFIIDLAAQLGARVILVSRNYLGSINHSLLTAQVCRQWNIDVIGWVFNDQFMHYEEEIVQWSGYPKIASLPFVENLTWESIAAIAESKREAIERYVKIEG
jgi:dethiobiotin synthetase